MSDKHKNAKAKAQAREREMDTPMSEGGTGGTFTKAATEAGYSDLGKFAKKVLNDPDASPKLKKKANFYLNTVAK